ncbi:MAG: hypothetical protein HeimC2_31180 [Candidatus Heimdallarchaeota archaeon LC_2]|nr:MAG: hypothetical protein HeimC2_31180 [Candidatus Heimdallarchaeota archaeon LC_2]
MVNKKELSIAFEKDLLIKKHAYHRIRKRGINLKRIEEVFNNDDIIEVYEDDRPYPSVLLLGFDKANMPLHIVCAPSEKGLIIITVYIPDSKLWDSTLKNRIKGETDI